MIKPNDGYPIARFVENAKPCIRECFIKSTDRLAKSLKAYKNVEQRFTKCANKAVVSGDRKSYQSIGKVGSSADEGS